MRDGRCDTATVRGEIHAEHTLKKEKTRAHTPHLGEPDGCSSGAHLTVLRWMHVSSMWLFSLSQNDPQIPLK